MTQRIEELSVGDLARKAGVTVRTLHHYDTIGLLKPRWTGANGYRLYGRDEALRLQEILFYRALGLTLADIAALLSGDADQLARLTAHRAALAAEVDRQQGLLATLDDTIAHLRGNKDMTTDDLYAPFSEEKQAEYEAWLVTTYGPEMAESIARSKDAVAELPEGMAGAMEEMRDLEAALAAAFEAGEAPESRAMHETCEAHRALMSRLWGRDCPAEAYAGLGQMYLGHPDFVARYERISPRFSQWLPATMAAHAERLG